MSVELKLRKQAWYKKENSQPIYLVTILLLVLLVFGLGCSVSDEGVNAASYMQNGLYLDAATITEILPEMNPL